jgi:hypothetical protein
MIPIQKCVIVDPNVILCGAAALPRTTTIRILGRNK